MLLLLSTLDFASYLSYSPHGTGKDSENSKRIMLLIKNDKMVSTPRIKNVPISEAIAKDINDELESLPFSNLFGKDVSLVPVPKSSLMKPGTLWVSQRIVLALCKFGLGKEFNCLIRREAVPQAHLSKSEDRPKPLDHYKTIDVQKRMEAPKNILLIDDIVTRGATLLGAASQLAEVFPNIPIRAFAVMRTISNPNEFEKINSPVVGKINLDAFGNTHRDP